jgi:ATP-dependent Clp protease ATP-binding subunit ClpC
MKPGKSPQPDSFDRFTERARRVLELSAEEAKSLGSDRVDSEHLLLGLVREGDGVAAMVLTNLGVELSKVRSATEFAIGRGEHRPAGEVGLSPRAKKAIELAVDEARRLGHHYIGTEHLLLGLIREGDGVAGLLETLGVTLEKVRVEVIRVLMRTGSWPAHQAPVTFRYAKLGAGYQSTGWAADDLTEQARAGSLDPVIGRDDEIARIIEILGRRDKNNPLLVGEPGVGKTAIVRRLAVRMASGDVPMNLFGSRILAIDAGALDPSRQESVTPSPRSIYFIDNIDWLSRSDSGAEGLGFAGRLRAQILTRKIQVIGAARPDAYQAMVESDRELALCFYTVAVGEPSVEEATAILFGLRPRLELHHRVRIADAAMETAIALVQEEDLRGSLPDRAVDLIEEAAASVRTRLDVPPAEYVELRRNVEEIEARKDEALRCLEYDQAAELRDEEGRLWAALDEIYKEWRANHGEQLPEVTEEHVRRVLTAWRGR